MVLGILPQKKKKNFRETDLLPKKVTDASKLLPPEGGSFECRL